LFLLPIDLKDARKKWCKHKDFKDENLIDVQTRKVFITNKEALLQLAGSNR
jgi:hypothetical protein